MSLKLGTTTIAGIPTGLIDTVNNKQDILTSDNAGDSIKIEGDVISGYSFDRGAFTIVGTPTITDKGIASGFSSSNYLTISAPSTTSSNITIQGSFTTGSTVTSVQMLYTSPNSGTFQIYINTDGKLYADFGDGSSWSIINNGLFGAISPNTTYTFKIETSSTKVKYYLNGVLVNTYTVTGFSFDTNTLVGTIGNRVYGTRPPFNGSIDLKQFSITADGVEVFNGTKPLSSVPHLITTYVDGTSGYRIWSDGYCEQWGYISGAGTVTFLKTFADTNYNISAIKNRVGAQYYPLSISAYTTDSITIASVGDNAPIFWRASGYLSNGQY